MAKVIEPRNISPVLKVVRTFLLGRDHINPLRFANGIAARTQPAPNLPDGPAHILSANYYYSRDGRREVSPPALLALGGKTKTAIASGEESSAVVEAKKALPTPGKVWHWD